MAIPPLVASGQVISAAQMNAVRAELISIREDMAEWTDDVDAGGHTLENVVVEANSLSVGGTAIATMIQNAVGTWAANVDANGKTLTNLSSLTVTTLNATSIPLDTWTPLTLLASWASMESDGYPASGWRKDRSGNLWIRIHGKNGDATNNTLIAVLPGGIYPNPNFYTTPLVSLAGTTSGGGNIFTGASGNIRVRGLPVGTTEIHADFVVPVA